MDGVQVHQESPRNLDAHTVARKKSVICQETRSARPRININGRSRDEQGKAGSLTACEGVVFDRKSTCIKVHNDDSTRLNLPVPTTRPDPVRLKTPARRQHRAKLVRVRHSTPDDFHVPFNGHIYVRVRRHHKGVAQPGACPRLRHERWSLRRPANGSTRSHSTKNMENTKMCLQTLQKTTSTS